MREYDSGDDDEHNHVYPRRVQFRLGLTWVHADAELFDEVFPHVMRLSIVPRPWDRLVRRIFSWLPSSLYSMAKTYIPGPFLPPRVALKKLQKDTESHVELFENEQAMYRRLQPLQGKVIPYFYGEATCEGKRAIVLSVVDGVVALKQEKPRLSIEELQQRLRVVAVAMEPYRIVYGDPKLGNLILVEDRVMLVDLEYAWEPDGDLTRYINVLIGSFSFEYNRYLNSVGDEHAQKRLFF
ncbi:Protein kinase-like domain protein [Niveomyces insectorum RCEF 264]|uniref:Protein kinase-like domain protein n=1 Tax=Niveomyces insectorum RCEF 264 TaxID=1081102 RepID=A0A167WD15_9HYPO|nr:Protein kinase-like domain protein [Niveomyces insectorum RCEF 264]